MKKITLISDTHSYCGDDVLDHCKDADEIWHGGDFGSEEVIDKLESIAPLRGVYGNIDGGAIRDRMPLNLEWECEGVTVFMTHIGGYPGRYTSRVHNMLKEKKPHLYICGHSHILKVMPDKKINLLHINPGACGHIGFHRFRTIIKFECKNGKLENVRAVELGLRGAILRDEQYLYNQ